MVLARGWSVALLGIDGVAVEIEADIAPGIPGVHLMGLPDAALREAKERIKSAVRNSGDTWPARQVCLAMSPADLPKAGAGYDLALACCVLGAAGALPVECLAHTVLLGELALDGRLRGSRGVLPALLAARAAGLRTAVVPACVLGEAALVDGIRILGAEHLRDVLAWLRGQPHELREPGPVGAGPQQAVGDLAEVIGQLEARWALEVAAAGGHHLLLHGPPGTGKTMLARRLAGLVPTLSRQQALEVTAIHSVAGALPDDRPLVEFPPFVAPHHSASVAAVVGGGSGQARPGAVSQAHNGILFLDEAAEFGKQRLDALRTALEEGEVRHARKDGIVRYPARFQLILATNPCPCAPARDVDCTCTPRMRREYFGRLSGPLMDRVDLRIHTHPLPAIGSVDRESESSEVVRERVTAARERAQRRWAGHGWQTNAEVPGPALRGQFGLENAIIKPLDRALRLGTITARGVDRCLRVAWTLADLAHVAAPTAEHVAAALEFRERGAA